MVDIGRRPAVPGANDNLSGVAALAALARALRDRPLEGLRVLLVSAGAEEALQEGIRGFARAHFPRLPRGSTWFVNLDTIGSGRLVLLEPKLSSERRRGAARVAPQRARNLPRPHPPTGEITTPRTRLASITLIGTSARPVEPHAHERRACRPAAARPEVTTGGRSPLPAEQRAAVDLQDLTRHEGGVRGGEVTDRRGHVLGTPGPSGERLRDQPLAALLGHAVTEELGVLHVSRGDHVGGDPFRPEDRRELVVPPDQRRLRGRVGPAATPEGGDRADADHAATRAAQPR